MKINLPEQYTTRVEMLPLIDIVFLLLVFFIYAMLSMAVHRGMEVELPVSANAVPEKDSNFSVTVRYVGEGDNQVFVDEVLVELNRLAEVLKEMSGNGKEGMEKEQGVLLFADRQVDYQGLFKVLDQINKAGLSRVSLQADVDKE